MGSSQPCGGDGITCIDGMGFLPVSGSIEGPVCVNSGDCNVDAGHIVGICVDTVGDGTARQCVPICQYADDRADFACAYDPRLAVREDCSRTDARAFLAVAMQASCVSGSMSNMTCDAPTPETVVTTDAEWTLRCHETNAYSCTQLMSCFAGTSFSDANATQTMDEFFDWLDAVNMTGVYTTGTSGGGIGDDCDSDCDCGHCGYCETTSSSGTCRYGGEGPYGCYRGFC